MCAIRRTALRGLVAAVVALTLFVAPPGFAATITIINADGPGEGFNDATPAAPVGGNPGQTVGAQRLYVFQYAAGIWGSILPSSVVIRVHANFDPMFCTTNSAVLGSGGPATIWRDFTGVPVAGHWYHAALANKLAGTDLYAPGDDINITFNSSLGGSGCMPTGWYYGVDGNEGSQIELLPVLLHELGHGLGFSTTTDGSTGDYASGYPSIYDRFLLDTGTGLHWDQMTSGQRAASAVSCQKLVWDGAAVTQNAPVLLNDRPVLKVNTPSAIAGLYSVGTASFGPPLNATGVTGDVVLVNDGVGTVTNGCEPLVNGSAVSGKIALADRGGCPFSTKVKVAQNAGAIAVIVADSLPGCPPGGMSGSDATITIPSVRITQADGNLLKSYLGSRVNVTIRRDPALNNGADMSNHVLLYTPSPYAGGSSVSHWDVSADPDLLMEPSLTAAVSSSVDLTRWFFADIGWNGGGATTVPDPPPAATSEVVLRCVPNPLRDPGAIRFWLPQPERVTLKVIDLSGREVARLLDGEARASGLQQAAFDPGKLRNGLYFLLLRTESRVQTGTIALFR